MDGAHEAFDNAKFVVDDFGNRGETIGCARCIGNLANKSGKMSRRDGQIRTTVCLESYVSRLTPHTYIGASAEGAEMITFLAPPFKWAAALSPLIRKNVCDASN